MSSDSSDSVYGGPDDPWAILLSGPLPGVLLDLPPQMEENGRSSNLPIPRAGMRTLWVVDESDNIAFATEVLGRRLGAPPAPPAAMPLEDAAREAARRRVAAAMERRAVASAMAQRLGGAAATLHGIVQSFLY